MVCTSVWSCLGLGKVTLGSTMRRLIFRALSLAPIPDHIAFILDGNRRYARKHNLNEGAGHRAGFLALMSMLKYCNELGVKYMTIYAFSIDNFRRKPHEVNYVMNLMKEKIEGFLKEVQTVNEYGVRMHFVGNLELLPGSVRHVAEKAMTATAKNDKVVLLICVAYTSTDEIVHAVQEACIEKRLLGEKNELEGGIKLADIEKHMYMSMAPDIDMLCRTSGESRLSNFLLWQTSYCYLYSPSTLWPEINFWNLVWAVLNFQRAQPFFEKKKKLSKSSPFSEETYCTINIVRDHARLSFSS